MRFQRIRHDLATEQQWKREDLFEMAPKRQTQTQKDKELKREKNFYLYELPQNAKHQTMNFVSRSTQDSGMNGGRLLRSGTGG